MTPELGLPEGDPIPPEIGIGPEVYPIPPDLEPGESYPKWRPALRICECTPRSY